MEFDPKLSVHGYCGVLKISTDAPSSPPSDENKPAPTPPAHHLLDAPYDLVGVVDELQVS